MHVAAQDLVLHTKLRTVGIYICILYNNGFGTQALSVSIPTYLINLMMT